MVDSVDGLVTNCRNARKYRGGWKVLRRRRKKEENGKCFLTGKCYRVKLILFYFLNHDSVLTVAVYSSGCSIVALNGI